ncbi:MAG: polysaccharide biosynthesis C-terminal domain-containing protein [Chitinophagaceae bacterium]
MGVIGKQSIQSSIFIYIGFAIGALNTLVLFQNHNYFTLEQFGLTKVLVDVSLLIGMLCTLGTAPAAVKFYPFYNSYLPRKENDLPLITLVTVSIGCMLFLAITPFFKELIIRKYGERSPLFVDYFRLIYPLTIAIAFLYLLESYSWAVKKTVLPAILREVVVRLVTTVFILLIMMRLINFNQFINLYSLIYVLPVVILFAALFRSGDISLHFNISTVTKRLKGRIIVFSVFIFSGQVLNLLARTLDSIIITSQSPGGLKDTGVFTIATYFIALMEVPVRSMTGITFAVLSQAWKDKDTAKVFRVYKKTALTLLIVGLAIMGLIVLNIQNVIKILGENYRPMAEVVLILGFSKLIDLGTGLNSHLLLSSKHWKIEFVTNVFLVLMAGVFNYFLVQKYGIVGSAWATLIAFTVYNGVRFFLIWRLFKMQPFDLRNLIALFIAACCFLICWALPVLPNVFIDSIVKSSLFIGLFGILIIRFKISPDVNLIVGKIYRRLIGRI